MQKENANYMRIAGIDEVGRGPLAGPVVAAAVIFPPGYANSKIIDSKKLSAKKREELVTIIKADALEYAITAVGHKRIDRLNIREATRLAMALSLDRVHADYALIDGNMTINSPVPHQAVVKGDSKFVQIAAASIIAKVFRDKIMETLDAFYPGYSFGKHSGYPTTLHRKAVAVLGPSPVHRKTFKGVKEYCGRNTAFSGSTEISLAVLR